MKRVLAMVLSLFIILSFAACSPQQNSAGEVEKVLGEVQNLPVDIDAATAQIGKNFVKYTSQNEGEALAVIEDAVLYKTQRTENEETESGLAFSYTITSLCIGSGEASDGGTLKISFVGVRVEMKVESDDVTAAKDYLRTQIDSAATSESVKKYNELIDGKTIYVTGDSELWNSFVFDTEIEAVCDKEKGSFEIKYNGPANRLIYDTTYDDQDRVIKEIAYYYDEAGKKYTESIEENSYSEDGTVHSKRTVYFSYTERISLYSETIDSKEITKLEYYNNGNLKREYYDYSKSEEEENFAEINYYENGNKSTEAYFDDNGDRIEISYRKDGTMLDKYVNLECVYDDRREQLPLKEVLEDGSWVERTYDEDYLATEKWYTKSGVLTSETSFYKSGRSKEITVYDAATGAKVYIAVLYDNEKGTESKFISFDDPDWYMVERHFYENGEMAKEIFYESENKIAAQKSYDTNGNLIG